MDNVTDLLEVNLLRARQLIDSGSLENQQAGATLLLKGATAQHPATMMELGLWHINQARGRPDEREATDVAVQGWITLAAQLNYEPAIDYLKAVQRKKVAAQ